jgi:hypothetical protein
MVAAAGLVTVLAFTSVIASLAMFTGHQNGTAVFGTKALFPGERVTPAFAVSDASSGSAVDRSSPFTAAGDGLTATTSAWSAAFDGSRYLEFDLNSSLAGGVAVSGATFNLRVASGDAGQSCFYLEVRRISTGAVLATQGSSGSPAGCVTGTSASTFAVSIGGVSSTDIANDLRIRVYGRESLAGPMVVDLATVSGSTPYQTFTLSPVVFRDAADTTPDVQPWALDNP